MTEHPDNDDRDSLHLRLNPERRALLNEVHDRIAKRRGHHTPMIYAIETALREWLDTLKKSPQQ